VSGIQRTPDAALAESLGYAFKSAGLLQEALTHPSASFEEDGTAGNERLEFLGDAVLDLVVGERFFLQHPDWREGELTRARAALVNTKALAERARELELGAYVRLGRTEASTGREKHRVLGNLFEAVIGAMYLDGGREPVAALVERLFGPDIDRDAIPPRDPKTRFQEWSHAERKLTPSYRLLADSDEQGAEDRFRVAVEVAGEVFGEGTGRTKQGAESDAARQALASIEAGA
jgi:ribonuclease-3